MRFPSEDFSNKYISASYQDVVQQFIASGSVYYLLDGLGNVIFQFPSASLGQSLLTNDQSASYSLNSLSASYAPGSPSLSASFATSASYATTATLATVALVADQTLSASVADTASYVVHAVSSSNALTASFLLGSIASATFALSASWASQSLSASVSTNSTSASYAITASYVAPNSFNVNILNNSTSSILEQIASIYNGLFIQYVLNDGVNLRAGNFVAVYTTASVKFTETSTTDIGNNDGVSLSASISASSILVVAMNSTDATYAMKYSLTTL